jgi:integration host factor subunit beta
MRPPQRIAMNKSDLTKVLSKEYDLSLRKAEEIVDMVFREMSRALISGDRIEIRGFGSFSVREYGGYNGRNPKTGEEITVKDKRLPFFKVGKDLGEQVNRD